MSLLEDLKKQAQVKSANEKHVESKTQQHHEHNWIMLAPKIRYISNYLKELAENLNIVNPEEVSTYTLSETRVIRNLTKKNFRIVEYENGSKNNSGLNQAISFLYDLVAEKEIKFIVDNPAEVNNIRTILNERGFIYIDKVDIKENTVFKIMPKLGASFDYFVDLEKRLIVLQIDNFDGKWSQKIQYKPKAITADLMDETAKYILNRPNKFMELSGSVVSDDMREKLRAKLRQDGKITDDLAALPNEKNFGNKTNKIFNIFKKNT